MGSNGDNSAGGEEDEVGEYNFDSSEDSSSSEYEQKKAADRQLAWQSTSRRKSGKLRRNAVGRASEEPPYVNSRSARAIAASQRQRETFRRLYGSGKWRACVPEVCLNRTKNSGMVSNRGSDVPVYMFSCVSASAIVFYCYHVSVGFTHL